MRRKEHISTILIITVLAAFARIFFKKYLFFLRMCGRCNNFGVFCPFRGDLESGRRSAAEAISGEETALFARQVRVCPSFGSVFGPINAMRGQHSRCK